MDWDQEYDLQAARGNDAGPSFSDRARNAVADDERTPQVAVNRARQVSIVQEPPRDTPLEQLTRHWMNERHAPDILPAQEELLASLLDHLRRQSETVQLLRGDPSTSEEDHIRIMLVQTEIERVKFIVRSYVRTRLFKIEKYARFISTNGDLQTRLTAAERDHAIRQAKMTDRHFHMSVLQSLPEAQSHLDDNAIFMPPMITEPDKTRPVFVHALQRCPRITLPDGTTLEMEKGHISLTQYSVVEHLVARGEVELV